MTEENKTCDRCIYDGNGLDISGSTCYLCKRNPVDHRIDWFEERSDYEYKYLPGALVKTLVGKMDPVNDRYIKEGIKGVVVKVWRSLDGKIFYAVNFLNLWSIKYNEDELELVEE